ncbi:MAG: DUF115 domain-containing protein, partial [Desulfobulbaceae bacterium]|nr:DUF115 domain-containing protein [Desulfobulbaceae bacterium]
LSNLTTIPHNRLLEDLQNAYADVPAILVSGGPSLDSNIDLLVDIQHKAVIIAVDGALPALLAHGIRPDFITAVDPKNLAYEKIAGQAATVNDISLLCTPTANPKAAKRLQTAHTFWAFTDNPLDHWLGSLMGAKTYIPQLNSVANLNIITANILGCTPIILVGHDFALTGIHDHAAHSVVATPHKKNYLNSRNIIWIAGTSGKDIPTTRAWLSLKTNFETTINEYPGQYINTSAEGSKIQGTTFLPLEEALRHYCPEEHATRTILRDRLTSTPCPDQTTILLHGVSSALNQTQNLRTALGAANNLAKTIQHNLSKQFSQQHTINSFAELPKNTQQHISELNAQISAIDAAQNKHTWDLVYQLIKDALDLDRTQKENLKQLQQAPDKYLQYLQGSLKRIHQTNTTRLDAISNLEEHLTDILTSLEQEQQLIKNTQNPEATAAAQMNLALHYLNIGNLGLARPILEKLHEQESQSGEINFHLGCIAAQQGDHATAEAYFDKAISADATNKDHVNNFQHTAADYYFDLYQQEGSRLQILLERGLLLCQAHPRINAELTLRKIREILRSPNPAAADDLIRLWHKKLQTEATLRDSLLPAQTAELHAHHGQLCMAEARFQEAYDSFQQALAITPDTPDYHILSLEASFSKGDFDAGINHLNKAVAINPAYARHWEEIGDSLLA